MSKLIDADALIKSVQGYNDAGWLEEQVDKQPTIDAVEVVRCKDCQIHNHCIVEDTFLTNGIKDGYCRAGKRGKMSERLTEWIDKNRNIAVPMPDLSYNYQKCFNKLAHYEDMKEQGRLIELPCIVGDILYLVTKDTVEKMKVYCISPYGEYCCKDHVWNFVIENRKYSLTCEFKDIGKTVFKTREEAEEKLKEMSSSENPNK